MILDGGNIVDSGQAHGKAIVSKRVCKDNKDLGLTDEEIRRVLEIQTGMEVALIPDPEDKTGQHVVKVTGCYSIVSF